jgi:YD repeat-containing protein
MKRKIFYLTLMSCLLFSGQAGAQKSVFLKKYKKPVERTALRNSSLMGELPVFPLLSGTMVSNLAAQQVARPTTVYREYPLDYPEQSEKSKYECEYDNYGHITSLKVYEWDGSNYASSASVVSEYHQLPNGEFVKTKMECEYYGIKQRYTSVYDDKGMQLWSQIEEFDFNTSKWQSIERIEAQIENGVRTAILYNGEVVDCTFDDKGRITHYGSVDGSVTYTWNNNDRIVEVAGSWTEDYDDDGLPDDAYTYTYRNIQIVHNEKYFNPYSLQPLDFDADEEYIDIDNPISWGNFSVDDYTLHEVFYNVDASIVENGMEFQAQMRTTVNNDGNHIERTASVETEITVAMTIDVLNEYGSYRMLEESEGNAYEYSVIYNEYGELIQNCLKINYGAENAIEVDNVYDRERDSQNRPVKTICSYKSIYSPDYKISWEETYDTWTTVGIQEIVKSAVSVYPNPAVENICLPDINGKVVLSDVNGRILLNRSISGKETIPISHLSAGVYFIQIQTNEGISTVKFIKK